jgi:hypothetical protein
MKDGNRQQDHDVIQIERKAETTDADKQRAEAKHAELTATIDELRLSVAA